MFRKCNGGGHSPQPINKVATCRYHFSTKKANLQRFKRIGMSEPIRAVVQADGIQYQYPQGQAFHFEDLTLRAGEHTLILGDSGSGKTTFLHILSGLLKPRAGGVTVASQRLYDLPARELDQFRGRHIGLMFQDAHLVKSLTVSENLKIAQRFAGVETNMDRIREVLEWLHLGDKLNAYPQKLSRGQVQRVAIARAVVNSPSILVADEPTASLDDRNTASVIDLLLRQAEQSQATLLVATHDTRLKTAISNAYTVRNLIHPTT